MKGVLGSGEVAQRFSSRLEDDSVGQVVGIEARSSLRFADVYIGTSVC